MSFFGSIIRDNFGPLSDIDVLVEFEPGFTPGYDFFLMEAELTKILGRRVDLQTPVFLSPEIRPAVLPGNVVGAWVNCHPVCTLGALLGDLVCDGGYKVV